MLSISLNDAFACNEGENMKKAKNNEMILKNIIKLIFSFFITIPLSLRLYVVKNSEVKRLDDFTNRLLQNIFFDFYFF